MAIITAIYSSPFSPPVVAPLPHSPTTVFLRPSFSTRSTRLMHWSGLRPPVWLSTGRWTPLLPLSYPSRPMRCLQSFETYRRLNATPRRGLRSLVARSRPPSLFALTPSTSHTEPTTASPRHRHDPCVPSHAAPCGYKSGQQFLNEHRLHSPS